MKQDPLQTQDPDLLRQAGAMLLEPDLVHSQVVRRAILLFSIDTFSSTELAIKINQLSLQEVPIIFIAKEKNADRRLSLCCQLALLEKLITPTSNQIKTTFVEHGSLRDTLKTTLQEGDLVISVERPSPFHRFFASASPGERISSALQVPVLILQDTLPDQPSMLQKFFQQIALWISVLATIIFFAFLQIKINQGISGWAGQVVLLMSLVFECAVIWQINAFFG